MPVNMLPFLLCLDRCHLHQLFYDPEQNQKSDRTFHQLLQNNLTLLLLKILPKLLCLKIQTYHLGFLWYFLKLLLWICIRKLLFQQPSVGAVWVKRIFGAALPDDPAAACCVRFRIIHAGLCEGVRNKARGIFCEVAPRAPGCFRGAN